MAAPYLHLPTDRFRICSGQRAFGSEPGAPEWSLCLYDIGACPWWRPEDKAGRQRRFSTPEAAERFRQRLEAETPPHWSPERAYSIPRTRAEYDRLWVDQ